LPGPGRRPESPADNDYQPGFAADLMLKDLRPRQEAAETADADTPMGAAAAALYRPSSRRRTARAGFLGDAARRGRGRPRLQSAVALGKLGPPEVVVAGYGEPDIQRRSETACPVGKPPALGLLHLACPVTPGSSGAPVMIETGAGWQAAGVMFLTSDFYSVAELIDAAAIRAACEGKP
jgi:hypothetical protein